MKIRLAVALVGLAIGSVLPTFAQQKDTVDPQIAQQIRALGVKYDEAFNKNDAAAVAALYKEDAVWRTPHGTFTGRQAIEKDYAKRAFQQYLCNNHVLKSRSGKCCRQRCACARNMDLYFSRRQPRHKRKPRQRSPYMDYSPCGRYLADPQVYLR